MTEFNGEEIPEIKPENDVTLKGGDRMDDLADQMAGGVSGPEKVGPGLYLGTKLIEGEPMDEVDFLSIHKGKDLEEGQPNRAGFCVRYPDGYVSWSPHNTFVSAYRLVTTEELNLLAGHRP